MRAPLDSRPIHQPEFGSLAGGQSSTVSTSEIKSALNAKVTEISQKVLPGVGLFLILAGIFDAFSGGAPAAGPWFRSRAFAVSSFW